MSAKITAEFEGGEKFEYSTEDGIIILSSEEWGTLEIPKHFADLLIEIIPKIYGS